MPSIATSSSSRFAALPSSTITNTPRWGRKGEVKKVRVDAEGHTSVLADVTLDPAMESMEIPLGTRAPDVAPAPVASAAANAEPGAAPSAKASAGPKKGPGAAPIKTSQPAAQVTSAPTAAPTAAPTGVGVANGLTIKPE